MGGDVATMFQVVDPQPVVMWWSIGGQESGGREEKRMASVIKKPPTHNTEEIAVETFNEWRGYEEWWPHAAGISNVTSRRNPG